jgi:hypothetical protein
MHRRRAVNHAFWAAGAIEAAAIRFDGFFGLFDLSLNPLFCNAILVGLPGIVPGGYLGRH